MLELGNELGPWLLLVAPALLLVGAYAVVTAVVLLGVVYGAWAKRRDGKDAAQARAFAGVRLSPFARVSGLLVEGGAQSLAFTLQTLHVLRLLPPVRGTGRGTPVLVLPGYTENSGTMWWLCRRLARAGFDVHPIDFPSTFADMERNKAFLRERIAQLRGARGCEVAVVAHSMGGVITRALALTEPDHGVMALVAFASPFRGTHVAGVGAALRMGRSVRQMCIGSEFMRRYGPERAMPMPTLCLVAPQEDIVTPEWSVVVAGADVRVLPRAYGHEGPIFLAGPFELARSWLLEQGVRCGETAHQPSAPAQLRTGEGLLVTAEHGLHDVEQDQKDQR